MAYESKSRPIFRELIGVASKGNRLHMLEISNYCPEWDDGDGEHGSMNVFKYMGIMSERNHLGGNDGHFLLFE